jgi:DNA-binding response OmpR family regulator
MSSPRVQGTILLIGDQDEVQATRAEGLRLQGYQVLTAATGLGAEAIGQHLGLDYLDLVILDPLRSVRGKSWCSVGSQATKVRKVA